MSLIALKSRESAGQNNSQASKRTLRDSVTVAGVGLILAVIWKTSAAKLPAWIVMWLMAVTIFLGCKWLTWRSIAPATKSGSWTRSLGYWFAWPGMDAEAFLAVPSSRTKPSIASWSFVLLKMAIGVVLVWGVAQLAMPHWPLVTGWIGLIGVAFVLHFGLFHLLALLWQDHGVDARPIMDWPVRAASVTDFWGKRWNRAFRQLAHRFLYRPMCGPFGPQVASGIAFLISGLVHDAAISIPARAGFGLPTAYFLIQFAGLSIERSSLGRRLGLRHGVAGRMFALLIVVLPAGLLFHAPFIHGVVLPMLAAMGALK